MRKSTSNNLKLISDGTNQKIQLAGVRAAWDTLEDLVEVSLISLDMATSSENLINLRIIP